MPRSKRSSGVASINLGVEGQREIQRALRALSEGDAPFLRKGLTDSAILLRNAARSRTHPSIAGTLDFIGIKGKAANLRAVVRVGHPGGRSREFGRVWYWTGYRGRAVKTGRKEKSSRGGQKAQPYMGIIKGDGAIGEVAPRVREILSDAISLEWERIAVGGEE